jgi:uncharacterized protein (TIGR02391 family)
MRFSELPSDQIALLPLDRLAYLVLPEMVRQDHWRNWLLVTIENRQLGPHPESVEALGDAIQWLMNRGLIANRETTTQGWDSVRVTRLGHRVIAEGLPLVAAIERLNIGLVPALEEKVRPQFLLGDFEIAAFAAMKEVEIAVRAKAGLSREVLGADVMKQAFKIGGPLADPSAHNDEQQAQMFLYAGAIGLFKNPASHRRVDYNDPTEASEILLLADLLLRMLARDEQPEHQ